MIKTSWLTLLIMIVGFMPIVFAFCDVKSSDSDVRSSDEFASSQLTSTSSKDSSQSFNINSSLDGGRQVPQTLQGTNGITAESHYIIADLPHGYVKDASVDYTAYIQLAVTRYDNLVFPNFPLLINDAGLKIGSGKTLTFLKGSELRLKPSEKKSYAILDIKSSENIKIYNPVIKGDRYDHLGTSGEWGMGISIKGSSNIKIFSPRITDCWGDGIYIGQVQNRINSKDIIIKDAYLSRNRRDGISIISVDGLLLENVYAGYTDGTKPMTGISFEPNNGFCELKNIRVLNPHTEFNGSRGIQVAPRHMLEKTDKFTDITIVNHVDIGSIDNAFKLSCNPKEDIKGRMIGEVRIINPSWRKTANDVPLNISTNQPGYKIIISSPEVIDTKEKILPYLETYSLFMKQRNRAPLKVSK